MPIRKWRDEMSEWKVNYQRIREAIESDDVLLAQQLVDEQGAYLRTCLLTEKDVQEIRLEHEEVYRMLEQRKNNIQDLLMEQASAQKVAKKYSDD